MPVGKVEMLLPLDIPDYVDFYSSRHHAENVGRIFRPGGDPLMPNWLHLPVGYHGRAGTIIVSGTPIRRPTGQRAGEAGPAFGPSTKLDIEAEVGFVVGTGSSLGSSVSADEFRDRIFGVVLVNDWSARDIQAWEYQPLGPFLGKSFATSISPWVVPMAALSQAFVPAPAQDPSPLPYLQESRSSALDIELEVLWNDHVVSRPSFREMYWTPGQQLAHLTINGASLRTGDLYASGTVSGPARHQRGSLLELSWNSEEPIVLGDGSARTFLEDGDTIRIRATAPSAAGGRLAFGEVVGTISPALPSRA
jgi:fumarylacetoacetase